MLRNNIQDLLAIDDIVYGLEANNTMLNPVYLEALQNRADIHGVKLGLVGMENLNNDLGIQVGLESARELSSSVKREAIRKLKDYAKEIRKDAPGIIGEITSIVEKAKIAKFDTDGYNVYRKIDKNTMDLLLKVFAPMAVLEGKTLLETIDGSTLPDLVKALKLPNDMKKPNKKLAKENIEKLKIFKQKHLASSPAASNKVDDIITNFRDKDSLLIQMTPNNTLYIRHSYIGFNDVQDNFYSVKIRTNVKGVETFTESEEIGRVLAKALSMLDLFYYNESTILHDLTTIENAIIAIDNKTSNGDISKERTIINTSLTNVEIAKASLDNTLTSARVYLQVIKKLT